MAQGRSGGPVPAATLKPPGEAAQQRAWAAFWLGLLSLLGLAGVGSLSRGVYVISLTLAIGTVAVWLGASTLSRARRNGTYRPRGAIGGTVLGGIGLTLSALALIAFAIFWKELSAYSTCMSGANTISAQQACQSQFSRSVNNEIKVLRSAGK
jgi:hypothetical protein